MKAKVCLGLAVGLVVFLLGGLVMNQMVTAQINTKLPWPPTSVVFEEDPYREHALQVRSFCVACITTSYYHVMTVPGNTRFIITDVSVGDVTGVAISPDGGTNRAVVTFPLGAVGCASFNSGIVFDEGEPVYILSTVPNRSVTISGYYIDL